MRVFRAVSLIFALAGLAWPQKTGLQAQLEAAARGYPGRVALYARDLASGGTVTLDADREVQTASVIKLALLLETYEQVKAGKVSLTQPLTLTAANQAPGSGIARLFTPGDQLTLHDALTLMITLSDNTATNMVIDAVGLAPTNAMLARMGLEHTYFYKKVFQPVTGPMPADQPKFGLGKTTAREMGELVASMYRCDLGRQDLCRDMITLMRCQQDREMIPRYIDANAQDGLPVIADKIGALDEVRNDVGLVYAEAGPEVISIFTYDNQDRSWTADNAAELLIGHLAQTIVKAWSPGGMAKEVPNLLAK